jgi:capreomycidine synthase
VISTHGSSEAIYLVMHALLRAGDEVIVLDPCYQQLASIAESLGCRLIAWRLRYERQFIPDIEELRGLIGPRTRMVVVNFPHNPTGATLSPGQQRALIAAVDRVGAYLVWDAAFAELTYDGPPLPVPNHVYERAVSLGTLSKAYGLPGLRVGWCVAAPEVIEHCVDLRDCITLHLSPLVELIAQRAIERADELLGVRLAQARDNLELLAAWVEGHRDVVAWARPQGGVCAFLRLRRVRGVEDFCRRLACSRGVLLIPGSCFNHPSHVRLGFGGPPPSFREGLARLSDMLRAEGARSD